MTPDTRSMLYFAAIVAACLLPMRTHEAIGQGVATPSLRGKSNDELLRIMIRGENPDRTEWESRMLTHLPDGFWTMPSKDAALALIETNSDAVTKQKFRLELEDTNGVRLPGGEIGLRWNCSHCYLAEHGMTVLRYGGEDSKLLYSAVKVFNLYEDVKPSAITRAVDQTRVVRLSEPEARHLYEVIWWLGRVKALPVKADLNSTQAEVERMISTGDGHATFWVSSQQRSAKVRLPAFTLNEQLAYGFDGDTRASCVEFLLREALEKHGVDLRHPTAAVGRDPSTYSDRKFVRERKPPDPRAVAETRQWVSRMLELLQNSTQVTPGEIIDGLVPEDEPLRYPDPRIDTALFRLVDRSFVRTSAEGEKHPGRFLDARTAARALAMRGRAELFPRLMKVLRTDRKELSHWKDTALKAAEVLTAHHSEFRAEFCGFVREQLIDPSRSTHDARAVIETAWRADFRDLKPELEKLATSSPDEVEMSARDQVKQHAAGRFHQARAVLTAWREPDGLTKLKLDAMLGAASYYFATAPEFLCAEYDALPSDQQTQFREFLTWMDAQSISYGVWRPDNVRRLFDDARSAERSAASANWR